MPHLHYKSWIHCEQGQHRSEFLYQPLLGLQTVKGDGSEKECVGWVTEQYSPGLSPYFWQLIPCVIAKLDLDSLEDRGMGPSKPSTSEKQFSFVSQTQVCVCVCVYIFIFQIFSLQYSKMVVNTICWKKIRNVGVWVFFILATPEFSSRVHSKPKYCILVERGNNSFLALWFSLERVSLRKGS